MVSVQPTPGEPASRSASLSGTPEELRAAFAALKTSRDVASLLDLPYWQLTFAIHRSSPETRYREVHIAKRRGGVRTLLVPNAGLARLQRKLLQVLSAVYRPKACVHGFVGGRHRSVVSNARPHVRRTWVLNIDLVDFFPSINFGRVRGMFRARPYLLPDDVATTLAQICSHQNQLPQGAPTSPIVSNMICGRLDGALLALAKEHRLVYTRFADDLTFSTRTATFPVEIAALGPAAPHAEVGPALEAVLRSNGFRANAAKCRLQGHKTRQVVTGIKVSRFPNVARTFVRRVRAMLHAWEHFGYEAAEARHRQQFLRRDRSPHRRAASYSHVLRGHLAYLVMVRGAADPLVVRLRERYGQLDPGYLVRGPVAMHELVRGAMWVLEWAVDREKNKPDVGQGTAWALDGVGLVTCAHVLGSGCSTSAYLATSNTCQHEVVVRARCDCRDLAVLEFPSQASPSLRLGAACRPAMGDQVNVAGFPNYQFGDTGHFVPSRVVSFRQAAGYPRVLVDGPIAAGMSGGPVVDGDGRVIGVIVSGAEELSQANMIERHGFIPVSTLVAFLAEHGLLPSKNGA